MKKVRVIPDMIDASGEDDGWTVFEASDPELPHALGRTGIASAMVYDCPFDDIHDIEDFDALVPTGVRVAAAEGYVVEEEPDPI